MRRRGRSPTERREATNGVTSSEDDSDDDAVVLDSDDQEALIRSLEVDARKQSKLFQEAFTAIGCFAMFMTLFVYPFLCFDECSKRLVSCWTHAIVSCGTHVVSIVLSRSMNNPDDKLDDQHDTHYDSPLPTSAFWTTPLFGLAVCLHILPLFLWVYGAFDQDIEHFHVGLVIGNIVTLSGASILLWDVHSTRQAIADLHGAKYEHKSL